MNNARSPIWLSAYVGVYAQTLTGRKQLMLFIFRRDDNTCQVHMPYVVAYVVPDVMGQPCPCAIFPHRSAVNLTSPFAQAQNICFPTRIISGRFPCTQ